MKANLTVQKAMGGAAKAMAVSNKQMDPQKLQATLMQFEKQQQLASMSEECAAIGFLFTAWSYGRFSAQDDGRHACR